MKTYSVFWEKSGVLTDNSYHVNTLLFKKRDKSYNAAKKVVLPPSSNPKKVKLHFAMLFIFVFYNINNYHRKMKIFDIREAFRGKMNEKKLLTCYLLSVNTHENQGEICRIN